MYRNHIVGGIIHNTENHRLITQGC